MGEGLKITGVAATDELTPAPDDMTAEGRVARAGASPPSQATVPLGPRRPSLPPTAAARAIAPPPPRPARSADNEPRLLVPVDVRALRVELTFEVASQRVDARAQVDFVTESSGHPVLDLAPAPRRVELDGVALPPSAYRRYELGDGADSPAAAVRLADATHPPGTRHRVIEREAPPGAHRLSVDYSLDPSSLAAAMRPDVLAFKRGGAELTTRMWDYGRGDEQSHFMEAYAPANLEFDQHPSTFVLRFSGARRPHAIFTNGQVRRLGGATEAYEVRFPPHFNASAPYLHVADPAEVVRRELSYRSADGRRIPVLVYATRSSYSDPAEIRRELAEAGREVLATMAAMEAQVGPYPHPRFLARLRPIGIAMEHAGAMDGDARLTRHELIHSWWGRGVLPADGRAGWIDEALTVWHERVFAMRGEPNPEALDEPRRGDDLGAPDSGFARHTSAYHKYVALDLLRELDVLLAPGRPVGEGLRPILRELFEAYKHRPLNVEGFARFVGERIPATQQAAAEDVLRRFGLAAQAGRACGACCQCKEG